MGEENTAAEAGGEGLDVQLAQELVQRARQEGVSLVGPDGLLPGVTRTVLQTALDADMTEHLGYAKGDAFEHTTGNHRNGTPPKTVHTEVGPVLLDVLGTGKAPLNRRSCPSTPVGSKVSMRPSSLCMPRA